jgi:predicted lactoylglutathione lyase
MATSVFVNLPVRDLDKSVAFFSQLGYIWEIMWMAPGAVQPQ